MVRNMDRVRIQGTVLSPSLPTEVTVSLSKEASEIQCHSVPGQVSRN